MNPYPYSLDNKRYQTFNYYLKSTYGCKVAKISLDGHFTCPNRDGTKGYGGCIFCSGKGSGDANPHIGEEIQKQYQENKEIMDRKWPNQKYIPYFQSFSNTYGPLLKIKEMLKDFITMDEVAEIAIATRPDCLDDEKIAYLDSLCQYKTIWLEIGIQSTKGDRNYLNRQYDFNDVRILLNKLSSTKIRVCLHLINGLPYETKEDMLNNIYEINKLSFHALKIHMMQVLKETKLAEIYNSEPFPIISREEYIDIVVSQLERLKPDIILQRLTGDPLIKELIVPDWVLNKTTILNDIDKLMKEKDTWQGKYYEQ